MSAFEGGKGGGPTPFVNAFKTSSVASLRYNTSQAGSPVPLCYGTQRVSINLIELWGEEGFGNTNSKGGKGLGGSASKKGSGQQYSTNVAFGVCQGPVGFTGSTHGFSGYNEVWANGSVAGANDVGLNGYGGSDGQAPDPVFASSDPNTPVLGYSGTCYVTGTPMQLGSTPALPNISFEITGFEAGTVGTEFPNDANPASIITDLLTNARYGAGFPSANLDTSGALADFGNYCQAAQIGMSLLLDRQQPCARWVEEIAQLTVSAVLWSGSLLKIIPYGDGVLSANGATWTPNLTAQYSLGDSDFLDFGGGSDPVVITRSDPSQATNWLSLEFQDGNNNYNPQMLPVWDQGLIDQYGTRTEPSIQAHELTNATSATVSAQLQLQRKAYIRNTYKFKLGFRYSLLEPMDIVLLTDATTGLEGTAVRITQIDEDDNGELTVTAEELPIGVGTAVITLKQTTAGTGFDSLVAPGNTNAPIIFEPPAALTGGVLEAWLIASGGANWGGCQIWISSDGSTYALAGTIYKGARQGVLTANLASHADPDTTDTLAVDLTESQGQLLSGTAADANNFVTLCYCDGELVSYETATLTAAYKYNLGTLLRRGVYGTPIGAHSLGANFARFGPNDPSLFKYTYPASFIGQTIYIKLPGFNIFGQALQSLSGLTADTYILTGAGALTPTSVPWQYLGTAVTAAAPVLRYTFGESVVFAAAFAGSAANAGTAATGTVIFDIALNGTNFATMTFAASATTATFAGTASSFAAGDVLSVMPRTSDATLLNLSGNFAGTA
jgi:hypothetical protein